jgi:hypothetical protein
VGPAILSIVVLALALTGCAQSSDTSTAARAGAGAPTASTPTTTTESGSATAPGSTTGLSVSPQVGAPSSVMHFAITPTTQARASHGGEISDSLSVMGPQRAGCVGIHQQALATLPSSGSTTVSLGPPQIGGNWCPGTYTARVLVLERPKCGQGQMCPQFIRVLGTIGPVSFRISG